MKQHLIQNSHNQQTRQTKNISKNAISSTVVPIELTQARNSKYTEMRHIV